MLYRKILSSLLSAAAILTPFYEVFAAEKETTAQVTQESSSSEKTNTSCKRDFVFSENKNPKKLDLFKEKNLDIALKKGLKFILNNKSTGFLDNKDSINKCILANSLLKKCIKDTVKYLRNQKTSQNDKDLEILKRLTSMKKLMIADTSIPKNNCFLRFVSAMKDAYQTVVSRKIAAQILADKRESVEKKLLSESVSESVDASAGLTPGGLDAEISVSANHSEGTTEKSFYRIDNSSNVGVSVNVGFKSFFSADVGIDLTAANAVIFYSLEQFLDAYGSKGALSSIELREPEIKKIIKSRTEMQQSEEALLSNMHTVIEWYLQMSEIVPQNTIFEWPSPTFASPGAKETSVTGTCKANIVASCLAAAGFNVSTGVSKTETSLQHPYISLLEKDCSVSEYALNAEEILLFLNQQKCAKYIEIKNHIENSTDINFKDLDSEKKNRILSILVSNINGDIHHYNSVLSILCDKQSTKVQQRLARALKHKIESNWLNNKLINLNHGRVKMLEAAIAIAAYLREFDEASDQIPAFERLYAEIDHLSKMQKFSKSIFKHTPNFTTSRSSLVYSTDAGVYFKVPIMGMTNLNINYSDSKSNAYFDNNENITVKAILPMSGSKIFGTENLKEKFKEIIKKLPGHDNQASDMFKESLSLLESEFDDVLKDWGIKKLITIPTVFSTDKYISLIFYLTKIPREGIGESNDTEKGTWVLKLVKRIDGVLSKLSLGLDGYEISATTQAGHTSSKIGSDTLSFITSRYDALTLGLEDSSNKENILWKQFKKEQEPQLKQLFKNFTQKDKNAGLELQSLSDLILVNAQKNPKLSEKEKENAMTDSQKYIKKFLSKCSDFSKTESQSDFEKSSELLDTILNLNYKYNYLPELLKIYR